MPWTKSDSDPSRPEGNFRPIQAHTYALKKCLCSSSELISQKGHSKFNSQSAGPQSGGPHKCAIRKTRSGALVHFFRLCIPQCANAANCLLGKYTNKRERLLPRGRVNAPSQGAEGYALGVRPDPLGSVKAGLFPGAKRPDPAYPQPRFLRLILASDQPCELPTYPQPRRPAAIAWRGRTLPA